MKYDVILSGSQTQFIFIKNARKSQLLKILSMKPVSFNNDPQTRNLFRSLLLLGVLFSVSTLYAQHAGWPVDSSIHMIDGHSAAYNNVHPGDTVYLLAGERDKLLIRNFSGSAGKPVCFMNKNGIVTISTNSYYGISVVNCNAIRLCGTGDAANFYGIQVKKVANGAGLGIGNMSSDVEVDHVSIEHCSTEGILAKTDPDCSFKASRDSFTQFNTSIHDNYIADIGNEGMYIGSSYYSGVHLSCNGKDTIAKPAVLDNVQVYNNIVKRTGWDGIQVSSAPLHCGIHHNTVINDSQAETKNQMSGILLGGGSRCDCYNNLVKDGKGDGIEDHGLGSNKIYNNVIVNAGRDFKPNDASEAKHGIFVSDVSVLKDAAFNIEFNDIIHPKSDGIRFQSVKSRHNLIVSNLIVDPGSYNLYASGNTSFTGNDAYVMIPDAAAEVQLTNNFFAASIDAARISATDYTPLPGSPLINKGYQQDHSIVTDFNSNRRPLGGYYDIGAMEYSGGDDRLSDTVSRKVFLFPNPVLSKLNVQYLATGISTILFRIYNLSGQLVMQQSATVVLPGMQQLQLDSTTLCRGTYLYCISQGTEMSYGKFIKQ